MEVFISEVEVGFLAPWDRGVTVGPREGPAAASGSLLGNASSLVETQEEGPLGPAALLLLWGLNTWRRAPGSRPVPQSLVPSCKALSLVHRIPTTSCLRKEELLLFSVGRGGFTETDFD